MPGRRPVFRGAETVLGLRRIPAKAGRGGTEPGCGAGCVRGDADRGRQVSVLPVACGAGGETDGGSDFAADRADAGPGGATPPDGNFGGVSEQRGGGGGPQRDQTQSRCRGVSADVRFTGTRGDGGNGGVAEECAGVLL